ncbi:MAG: SemiSWEET family transporter [Chloroflexi bacterium]|nr:SemiSWEET family transporter [Chloroflexota bacterium]
MAGSEILGLVAGAFVTLSLIPQVMKVFKLKSAREISMMFTSLMFIGLLLWLGYGIWLKLFSVILWNVIAAIIVSVLLFAKIKYDRKKPPYTNH